MERADALGTSGDVDPDALHGRPPLLRGYRPAAGKAHIALERRERGAPPEYSVVGVPRRRNEEW